MTKLIQIPLLSLLLASWQGWTVLVLCTAPTAVAFVPATVARRRTTCNQNNRVSCTETTTLLFAGSRDSYKSRGGERQESDRGERRRSRSSPSSSSYHQTQQRSKRQERVGQLVQTELSRILHAGLIKGGGRRDVEYLEDSLRQRISVVSANVSPDLRQARVSVSIRTPKKVSPIAASTTTTAPSTVPTESEDTVVPKVAPYDPIMDKRRAYSWLVHNAKSIRHALAQRMSHLKSCPDLTFVQVDTAAAVDVMYLIDQVASKQTQRSTIDFLDGTGITWEELQDAQNEEGDDSDFDDDSDDDDSDDDDDWMEDESAGKFF